MRAAWGASTDKLLSVLPGLHAVCDLVTMNYGGGPMLLILIAYQKEPFDSTYKMQFSALLSYVLGTKWLHVSCLVLQTYYFLF